MARTVLIEATAWDPVTGADVSVALAGGGSKAYRWRSRNDWRAGVVAEPRFSARIDFDENGFAGGARPSFGTLEFSPAKLADFNAVAGLLWNGCDIEVRVGDDSLAVPTWTMLIKGTVEDQAARGATLILKVRDASGDLDKPVASDRFLGTGGIEGDALTAERTKRRSFGRVSNVELRIFKEATNLYEGGDPAFPIQAFDDVKDIGRSASSRTLVAWAGTFAATVTALEAAAVEEGGCAVAPSINLVRWWTRPVGPLTADIRGEVGAGYVETLGSLAQRVIATRSALTVSNIATADGWRPGEAGIHFDNPSETVAQGLDRLCRGCSLAWFADAAGAITLSQISFSAPVETVKAVDASRTRAYRPLLRRRVGYRRNHRVHSESELSQAAALGFFVQDTAPSFAASSPGQLWQDAEARYWRRRDPIQLAIAGNILTINGVPLTMTWTPSADQPVKDEITNGLIIVNLALDAVEALALDAQATADGKVQSFIQASPPVAEGIGDLWFDSDDGNKQYRWSGSAWGAVQDASIGQALLDAAGAQATADGKVATFISESTPTAEGVGDLWFKASTGALRRWNGSTWGDPLVDLTAAAQVIVVPPATLNIYRTSAGAVKADQLPIDLRPSVTRGGVDYRTDNAVSYSVTGTGGLAGKVTVNNTNGSASKGDVTLANTITGAGTFQLSVSVSGVAVGTYITQVNTVDDAPPVDNGTSGGTDSSLEAVNTTSYVVLTSQDGGDPVLDVAITSGQTLKLNANFYYRNAATSSLTMTCKAEYYTGSVWADMNNGGYTDKVGGTAQKLLSPVEYVEGDMVAEWTKTGLATGTYPVRLVGKLTSGSGTLTPTSGGATSSKS